MIIQSNHVFSPGSPHKLQTENTAHSLGHCSVSELWQ